MNKSIKMQSPPWLVQLRGLVPACELKGRWFDSQSGHMPGFQTRSPVGGAREATDRRISCTSLSFSLPSPCSQNQ